MATGLRTVVIFVRELMILSTETLTALRICVISVPDSRTTWTWTVTGIPDGCEPCEDCDSAMVMLDSIDGLVEPGVLASGRPINFYLRVMMVERPVSDFIAGFRFYAPDGAVRNPIVVDTVPGFGSLTNGSAFWWAAFSNDGLADDSIRIRPVFPSTAGNATGWL